MVIIRTRKDGTKYPIRQRPSSGIDIRDFQRAQLEDEARVRLLTSSVNQQADFATKFKHALRKLSPDKIEFALSADMAFLKGSANFTWDLARRKMEDQLTKDQKMKLIKAYYGI